MNERILVSRNKREGEYVGWRQTAGKRSGINHERTGGGKYQKGYPLKSWAKL